MLKRFSNSDPRHEVIVRPDGLALRVSEEQTILEAAFDQDVSFPHGCKIGQCGLCKSRLIEGEVLHRDHERSALTDAEKSEGLILPCMATPTRDLSLAPLHADRLRPKHPVRTLDAQVTALSDLTHDIKLLRLGLEDATLQFLPGQYVQLTLQDGTTRDYSLANMPGTSEPEFHIRRVPGGDFSETVHQTLAIGDKLRLKGPFGSAHLRTERTGPIIAIAGGSGLAPVKSIVDSALNLGMKQPIHVYFGGRETRDLYLLDHFRNLQRRHANLTFTPVLSGELQEASCRTGLVTDAVKQDFSDLAGWTAYAAGPPAMIEAAFSELTGANLAREHIYADIFFTPETETIVKSQQVTRCR
ncbi:FAD-binding oxidoreductase [Thalassovita aquimarina]|uniref:2Fe-2S iron-sulfur cluster binding domain-containing protein n=1 Tax=Thalassovita aquimarina TaxID=2785917 RepID=A0ABS5HWS9_9RHOB|nr:FAD-binding oxidoreductase [Thalassovita aquimarina]MBR9653424.1 2Fe-2S iron-sulfur cluster binding domain-containing protein [Thalassovita aquimarina]